MYDTHCEDYGHLSWSKGTEQDARSGFSDISIPSNQSINVMLGQGLSLSDWHRVKREEEEEEEKGEERCHVHSAKTALCRCCKVRPSGTN